MNLSVNDVNPESEDVYMMVEMTQHEQNSIIIAFVRSALSPESQRTFEEHFRETASYRESLWRAVLNEQLCIAFTKHAERVIGVYAALEEMERIDLIEKTKSKLGEVDEND